MTQKEADMQSQKKANRTPRSKATAQIRLINRPRKRGTCAIQGCCDAKTSNGVCEKHNKNISRKLEYFFTLGLGLTEILAMPGVPSLLGSKSNDHPFIRRAAIFLNQAARHWRADQAADGRQGSAAA